MLEKIHHKVAKFHLRKISKIVDGISVDELVINADMNKVCRSLGKVMWLTDELVKEIDSNEVAMAAAVVKYKTHDLAADIIAKRMIAEAKRAAEEAEAK